MDEMMGTGGNIKYAEVPLSLWATEATSTVCGCGLADKPHSWIRHMLRKWLLRSVWYW